MKAATKQCSSICRASQEPSEQKPPSIECTQASRLASLVSKHDVVMRSFSHQDTVGTMFQHRYCAKFFALLYCSGGLGRQNRPNLLLAEKLSSTDLSPPLWTVWHQSARLSLMLCHSC